MENIVQQEIPTKKAIFGAVTFISCATLGGLLEISLLFKMADVIDKKYVEPSRENTTIQYVQNTSLLNYTPKISYSNESKTVSFAPHEVLSDLEK